MTGRIGHIGSHFSSSVKLIAVSLLILLLVGQSGCATTKPYTLPPPPSEAVRTELGTVGIASARFLPKVEMLKPKGKASGAAAGAGIGAGGMIEGGAMTADHDPLGLLLGLALAPVGAVVGGVVGAVEGVSSKQRNEAEDAINKAVSQLKIQATMKDYILRVAQQQTGYHFVDLDGQGPETPEGKVDYSSLANGGIDTVLEISVPAFGLVGTKGINPPLAFFMSLQTRLVRTKDGAVLYEQKLEYRNAQRTFTAWAAKNAEPFRVEFNRCYQSLAEKVVEEIFLLYNVPLNPASRAGSRG
jgi:hypothetical protein